MMMSTPAVMLGFALVGLVVGSFLNVCIYRIPRRESLAWPASHCTACNRPLAWFENVPIVSWLALRGRAGEDSHSAVRKLAVPDFP